MLKRFLNFLFICLILLGCGNQTNEINTCQTQKPPLTISSDVVPSWEIEPRLLLWETTPKDNRYPFTSLTYEVTLKNNGSEAAKNVHVYIESELSGQAEMAFDDKGGSSRCSELPANGFNVWGWGRAWDSHADPQWRSEMEKSAVLRIVWQDSKGWHQIRGHLPSQYAPNKFKASDLNPV